MTATTCPRTTLVEALRDGRLGAQESASMERHIEGCGECSAHARDLAKIGDVIRAPREPLTQLEHQRARVALLQRAATSPAAKVSSDKMRFVFAAVAMAAAVALGWFGGAMTSGSQVVAVALRMPALPSIDRALKMGLHPSDDARFSHNRSADVDEVMLEHGALELKLPPLAAGKRFVVRTKDAKIEVRATALRVEAEEGRIRSVAVEQGTVEVEYAGFTAVIPAGGSWRATTEPVGPSKSTQKTEAESEAPPAPTSTVLPGKTATVWHAPRPAPMAAPTPPPVVEPAPAPAPQSVTATTAEPIAPSKPMTSPPAGSKAFADAMGALSRGDYAGSAEKLRQFTSTHPTDARADEADYLTAVALQRAGRKAEAAAAAKRYLANWPQGAHRRDAARIARE